MLRLIQTTNMLDLAYQTTCNEIVNNFSLCNIISVFTHTYFNTLSLIPQVKKFNLSIFSLKFFCKDKILNYIKNRET